jgi:hemolysin activation/secretion protein
MSHVLRSKKTVNLKDLESPQGHRMKKSTSENEASDVTDCGIKGSSNVLLSTKRKKDMELRCYVNNAKSRRTQTSEDLGFQVCYD